MATISSTTPASRRVLPLRGAAAAGESGTIASGAAEPTWHRSAPVRVSRAESWGSDTDGWNAWSAHLARRSTTESVAALLPGKLSSLAWGIPSANSEEHSSHLPATRELITGLDRFERGKSWSLDLKPVELTSAWLAETAHRHPPKFGLECLAWARALPALAAQLPGDTWWQLLDRLLHVIDESSAAGQSTLDRQWLAVELPLVLAHLLPELKPARELAQRGGEELATAVRTVVAADGMPSATLLDEAQALLGTWARSRLLAQRSKKADWNNESEERFANFARQTLRLSRRDGTLAFSSPTAGAATRDLLTAAFDGAGRSERALASTIIRGRDLPANVSAKSLPPPATNNESAGVTVLRPNWARGGERVTLARSGGTTRIELAIGRDVLWSGPWTCEVRRNGQLLVPEPDAEWDEVCWTSTEDADYLELELALPDGIRVQRQIVLAREDGFLFLADAVLGTEPAALAYTGGLPLVGDVHFDPSTETREGYIVGSKPRGLVFPLALHEWRSEPSAGSLEAMADQSLALRAARQEARCLYAPLFVDLHPRRLFRPATWRQLTVAENRQTLSPDVAVGYRVQIRNEHWLIYRALGDRGNRTVIGHNLVSEFLVARFKTDGDIEPLVEIE